MSQKEFTVRNNGNIKFRLKISPTEVTIKMRTGSDFGTQHRVLVLFEKIAQQPEMLHATETFKGVLAEEDGYDVFTIQMISESGLNFNYKEKYFL